jgi:hypothetical protein
MKEVIASRQDKAKIRLWVRVFWPPRLGPD